MRIQFMNDAESIQWLKDVHVGEKIQFESAIVYGNEDAPDKIELFTAMEPDYRDMPCCIILGGGV